MTDQDQLMQFDVGTKKKTGKKPVLGNRKRKPFGSARQEAQQQKPLEENQTNQQQNTKQPPMNQQKIQEQALPTQKQQQQNPTEQQQQDEEQTSLKTLLQSKKFQDREKGYQQLIQWNDPSLTKSDFIRDAHVYAKEKHFKVVGLLIEALESVINDSQFQQNLNFPQFYLNLIECIMSNVKKQTQEQLDKFICDLWDSFDNKDQFIEEIKKHLGSKKVNIQNNSCLLILQLLNAGYIKQLKNLDPLWPDLIKVMNAKSPKIRKSCMNIFKEAYLWLGPGIDPQIEKLNKAQEKEFKNYKDQISQSSMKMGQEKTKNAKENIKEKQEQKPPQTQESQKRGSKIQTQQTRQSEILSTSIRDTFSEDISNQEAVDRMIEKNLLKNVHEDFSIEDIEQIEDLDDVRASIFSEKNLKLEDKKVQTQIILLHLKQILKITNDFKEMNKIQTKQLYNILNQIIVKYDNECINQNLINVYSIFFIDQMINNCKEDIFKLFQTLTNQKEKIIVKSKDLTDLMFDIIQKKNITPNKDLVCSLARVIETEIVSKQNIQAISSTKLLKFIKNQKNLLQEDQEIKDRIFNLMRNIQDNFGKNTLSEYPPSLMKEFEAQNKEIEKSIIKTIQKLKEKNVEKRKQALLELVDVKDYTQMQMLWENKEFQNFIKRSLITETQNEYYQKIIQIIENYLQFQRESPADFNLKHYLYVFHTIITQYYDIKEDEENYENKKRLHILQNIFKKTTDWLEPTIIFNQLINDLNAQNWREQICGFFLEYQESIELEPSFMDYIIEAYTHFKQSEGQKSRSQIEKVIISLKNCKNQEIQDKGNKNRNIKKIWQQSEEQILFGEDFLEFEGVFKNKGFYNSIKKFILKALDMNESNFFSLRIDSIRIDDAKNTSTKPKLAYFYLRSNENLIQISEHILNQINSININKLDQVSILIIFKTLINIMRNNYYCRQDSFYEDTIETFMNLIQLNRITQDDLNIMNLTQAESKVYSYAINYSQQQEDDMNEGNDIAPSMIGNGIDDTYMMSDQNQTYEHNVSFNQYPPRDQISITTPQESAFRKKYQTRRDDMSHIENQRVLDDYSQNLQSQKSYYSKQSQRNLQNRQNKNIDIDLQMELNIILDGMLSFDMEKVEKGKIFIIGLIESQDQQGIELLTSQMNNIFKVFVEMFEAIFEQGINYDVDKDSYELIFEPIKQIISNQELLVNLNQDMLNRMVEEVLNKLVQCNEEKIQYEKVEPNKEYFEYCDMIVKYFNGIMLRLLKNINFNKILESLFLLLFHYNNLQHNDIDKKIFDLDLLCINRITTRMSKIIDQVDAAMVLKQIDSYETQIGINNPQNAKGSRIIKTMLKELVNNFNPQEIWQAYSDIYGNLPDQNNIIFNFINILQKNQQNKYQEQSYSDSNNQLLELIDMANRDTNQQQLKFYEKKIAEILNNDPQINLRVYGGYFSNKQFFNYLVQNYDRRNLNHQNSQKMDDILNQSSVSFLTNKSNLGKRRYKQL